MINSKIFTQDEQAILRSLPSPLKWIARDRDGWLFVYEDKPKISVDEFISRDSNTPTKFASFALFKRIFKGITFENSPIRFRGETLDEVERRYLKNVFSPFRRRIAYVSKHNEKRGTQFIMAVLKNNDRILFPSFKPDTMYKGMEVGETYSLEDLGIKY